MKPVHGLLLATVLAAAYVVSGVANAQDFLPYEGKDAIKEGDGGTKKVVDGVDFWTDGQPPRPYKLLGFISDRRHKSGLFGAIRMAGLDSNVAEVAKKNGGDAVILVAAEAETVGQIANAHASGGWATGTSAPVQKQQSKFAVVKYVVREKPPEIAPNPPAVEGRQSSSDDRQTVPPPSPQ